MLGWRAAFVVIAALMGVAGLMIALVVREPAPAAPPAPASRETLAESILGIRAAMRVPSVGRLFLMQMATYSSFVLFVGLWGGPYLSHVYGYDLTERGNLLLVPAVTQIFGLALYGWSDRVFGGYRAPVALGAFATAGLFVLLAVFGTLPHGQLIAWLVGFGALAAFTPVVHAHSKALFPPALVGRGMTLLNMGSMGGVFVTQSVSGVAIDLFAAPGGIYPLASYRLVFALQAAFLVIAAGLYLTARDPLASRFRSSQAPAADSGRTSKSKRTLAT
jgi:MFS family permease